MGALHPSAKLHRDIERKVCDRSTSELLEIIFRGGLANAVDVHMLTRLIDSGQIVAATHKPDALAGLVELPPIINEVLPAALEIARRASLGQMPVEIRGPADVAAIAQRELAGRTRECVLAVACDASNHVIRTMMIAQGSADSAPVPVREILNAVLRCDGRAFAIAHNHPVCVVEPTDVDVVATARISAGAHAVGLRFLGHVIVGEGEWTAVATTVQRTLD